MTVITDITVPADEFALGRLFDSFPDITIELERLVPLDSSIIPLFWIEGQDPEDVERTIRTDSMTDDVNVLTTVDERILFEIRWNPEVDALITPLKESNAEVLRATGSADVWEFRLQFRDRTELADFRDRCQEHGLQMRLAAIYNPSHPESEQELSEEQYDIISTAYTNGYWNVPRNIELQDLAELIGISQNAASQRMRRGLSTVVGSYLESEDELPTTALEDAEE